MNKVSFCLSIREATELLWLSYDVWQKPLVNACTLQYYHNLKANDEMMIFLYWNNKGWSTLSNTHKLVVLITFMCIILRLTCCTCQLPFLVNVCTPQVHYNLKHLLIMED